MPIRDFMPTWIWVRSKALARDGTCSNAGFEGLLGLAFDYFDLNFRFAILDHV
jgi:hypothetical protein